MRWDWDHNGDSGYFGALVQWVLRRRFLAVEIRLTAEAQDEEGAVGSKAPGFPEPDSNQNDQETTQNWGKNGMVKQRVVHGSECLWFVRGGLSSALPRHPCAFLRRVAPEGTTGALGEHLVDLGDEDGGLALRRLGLGEEDEALRDRDEDPPHRGVPALAQCRRPPTLAVEPGACCGGQAPADHRSGGPPSVRLAATPSPPPAWVSQVVDPPPLRVGGVR